MFVLNAYETELCKKDNELLWNIIVNKSVENGYYIDKAGEKVYVVIDIRSASRVDGYAVTSRIEDGEEIGCLAYFVNGVLRSDIFESDPSFLPEECPMILEFENRPVTTVITAYDPKNGISFTHKGVGYMTKPVDEFDPDNYEWWGSFILNTIPELNGE